MINTSANTWGFVVSAAIAAHSTSLVGLCVSAADDISNDLKGSAPNYFHHKPIYSAAAP